MSLIRTLATVAAGVALAKGAQAVSQRARSGGGGGAAGGGGLLDALQDMRAGGGGGGSSRTASSGGLGDLGALLGGRGQSGGGIGDILNSLGGGGTGGNASAGGGLGGLLTGALGGQLGGQLGQMLGGAQQGAGDSMDGLGARLNEALTTGGEPKTPPTPAEEAIAGLMIRAMIMAAKSDGRIDAAERETILGTLKDASPEERAFIQEELAAPIDVRAFAGQVPDDPGLRRQVFATALLAIDLDSEAEARFMGDLASALGLRQSDLDAIMGKMGGGGRRVV